MPALSVLFRLNDPIAEPAGQYEAGLQLIEAADRMGLDGAWVTSHHFGSDKGSIASPLLYLAAASQRTRRIRLGAGVVVLTLEDPLRVAEDAALASLLSRGRLELGLGSGLEPWAFPTFGVPWEERHTVFAAKLARLKHALGGGGLEGGRLLHPPGQTLLRRIWRIAADPRDAEHIGREGDNLILGSSKQMNRDENRARQAEAVRRFRAAAGRGQKVALSQPVFVGANGEAARARYDAAIPASIRAKRAAGDPSVLAEGVAIVGDPKEVRTEVLADPIFREVDEVLAQIVPAKMPVADWIPSLRLLRTHVFPDSARGIASGAPRIANRSGASLVPT